MVYLITFGDRKYCKIGHTKDVGKRIASMQTSLPLDIELVACIEGDIDTERAIQGMFSSLRTRGEWFIFDKKIEDLFNNDIDVAKISKETPISRLGDTEDADYFDVLDNINVALRIEGYEVLLPKRGTLVQDELLYNSILKSKEYIDTLDPDISIFKYVGIRLSELIKNYEEAVVINSAPLSEIKINGIRINLPSNIVPEKCRNEDIARWIEYCLGTESYINKDNPLHDVKLSDCDIKIKEAHMRDVVILLDYEQ